MRRLASIAASALLVLASAAPRAEIHKCRQGERLIYQEAPCPAGSLALPPPLPVPRPSAYAVEEARQRASDDIAAAEALRLRELKDAEARQRLAAAEAREAARQRERACAAARDRGERAQSKEKTEKRGQVSRKKDRRDEPPDCGTR